MASDKDEYRTLFNHARERFGERGEHLLGVLTDELMARVAGMTREDALYYASDLIDDAGQRILDSAPEDRIQREEAIQKSLDSDLESLARLALEELVAHLAYVEAERESNSGNDPPARSEPQPGQPVEPGQSLPEGVSGTAEWKDVWRDPGQRRLVRTLAINSIRTREELIDTLDSLESVVLSLNDQGEFGIDVRYPNTLGRKTSVVFGAVRDALTGDTVQEKQITELFNKAASLLARSSSTTTKEVRTRTGLTWLKISEWGNSLAEYLKGISTEARTTDRLPDAVRRFEGWHHVPPTLRDAVLTFPATETDASGKSVPIRDEHGKIAMVRQSTDLSHIPFDARPATGSALADWAASHHGYNDSSVRDVAQKLLGALGVEAKRARNALFAAQDNKDLRGKRDTADPTVG